MNMHITGPKVAGGCVVLVVVLWWCRGGGCVVVVILWWLSCNGCVVVVVLWWWCVHLS